MNGKTLACRSGGKSWYSASKRDLKKQSSPSSISRVTNGETASIVAPACSNALRSEEHTSELQSRENLVCRLLLEKKKKKQKCALFFKKKKKTKKKKKK